MNPANHAARKLRVVRRIGLNSIVAAGLACGTGCATGGQVWHAGASAMSGLLWSRATAEPGGYDAYAQQMANSKAVIAARGGDPNQAAPAAEPAPKPASGDGERKPSAAPEPLPEAGRQRPDPSLRVTLGRPESVPVLKADDGKPGPLMAAAAPRPEPALGPEVAGPEPEAPREPQAPAAEPIAAAPAQAEPAVDAPEVAANGPEKSPEAALKALLDDARDRLEAMQTYQVAITRTERVNGSVLPEEKALLSIRRNPKAVRLEWPDGPNQGREVIYSAAINDRMMHVNVANSAIPIPRMTIPVDSVLALRNSRHAITEAGFDTIFNNLSKQVDAQGRPTGAEGRLTYKGLQAVEGVDRPCHLIQRITPTKEIWRVFLDPDSLMPVVVTAHQADGGLLESYRYERLKANPTDLAAVEAFDPDKRWGESKGLFSRLARAAGGAADAPAPTTTR
ncbi:MAG: hypothetical protein BGO49_09265 [Planctomycetales bacterium 71-10]|nr:MAG: hypothetical protein BGO49_09265 [Planctomycetales bacterium 71-10]